MKIIKIAQDITLEMVQDPNCSPEVLAEVLKRGENDNISYHATDNPNCPPEALAEVLRRGNNDGVSMFAARNPNCPPEILAEVLRRGNNDDVSRSAVNNHNCPPEEAWLWLNTAYIYDPLGILNYLDASPEIKNNPKITQLVKQTIVNFLNNNFNNIFPVPKSPFNYTQKAKLNLLIDELSDEDFLISLYAKKIDEVIKEEKTKRKINVGDRVRIVGGGVSDNQNGTVVNSWAVKTDGHGVPTNVDSGNYKPVDWSKEVAIRLDNGKLITMFKNYLSQI